MFLLFWMQQSLNLLQHGSSEAHNKRKRKLEKTNIYLAANSFLENCLFNFITQLHIFKTYYFYIRYSSLLGFLIVKKKWLESLINWKQKKTIQILLQQITHEVYKWYSIETENITTECISCIVKISIMVPTDTMQYF